MAKPTGPQLQWRTLLWLPPALRASSWLISLALHAALFVALGTLSWVTVVRPHAREITVGIVVKKQDEQGTAYEGGDGELRPTDESPAELDFLPDENPTDSTNAEPELPSVDLAPIGVVGSPVGSGAELVPVPTHVPAMAGPRARARFFGAESWGSRFVFAVDRSGSMATNNALGAAKQELLRALNALPPTSSSRSSSTTCTLNRCR